MTVKQIEDAIAKFLHEEQMAGAVNEIAGDSDDSDVVILDTDIGEVGSAAVKRKAKKRRDEERG